MSRTIYSRMFFVILLSLTSLASVQARSEKRVVFQKGSEFRIGIGYAPFDDYSAPLGNVYLPLFSISHQVNRPEMDYYYGHLGDLYSSLAYDLGSQSTSGVVSATYSYRFFRWFELSASVQYSGHYSKLYESGTTNLQGSFAHHMISVLPTARFVWYRSRLVSMYGSVSLGLGISHETLSFQESQPRQPSRSQTYLSAAYNLNYFGITVGRKVYAFCDLSVGYMGLISAGIGFRL